MCERRDGGGASVVVGASLGLPVGGGATRGEWLLGEWDPYNFPRRIVVRVGLAVSADSNFESALRTVNYFVFQAIPRSDIARDASSLLGIKLSFEDVKLGKRKMPKKMKELSVGVEEPPQQQQQQIPRKRGRPRKIAGKIESGDIEEAETELKKVKMSEEAEEQ
ncbi:hypothetical protein RHGRI_006372 [Rhododendron griersonianum]|uniref:Uncharacterized protein n=1 Tax=Rhododendron griersonianum TaxID=479676 RepID=A0AAV6KTW8_9ERIC|nr:hypothetical protein RHGRI_006372 [Rhododendron griersonianum]